MSEETALALAAATHLGNLSDRLKQLVLAGDCKECLRDKIGDARETLDLIERELVSDRHGGS